MTTIADVFDRYDLDLHETDFARELAHALERDEHSTAVSAQMLTDIVDHGGLTDPQRLRDWSARDDQALRAAVHATSLSDLLAATVSATQAAQLLGISTTRLSHRATAIPLLTSKVGRYRRYYRWQFVDGHVLPGLAILTGRLTGAEHPLDVAAVMTTPAEDLDGRTPVEYLASGGSPDRVAELLDGLTF